LRSPTETEAAPEAPRLLVRLASDALTAFVTVRKGTPAGERTLQTALDAAGIRSGIDEDAFARLVSGLTDAAFTASAEVIARGTAAEEGEDGRFEPQFRNGIQAGHVRDDGTIDFHDRELLKPVERGDVLGRVLPARAGIPGCRVDGTAVPVKATREAAIKFGPGVERDEQGVVRATRAGVIDAKGSESLDVVDHHLHKGPVDIRSGNLHMQGSLVVQGDVQRSFSVQASGDIEIRGHVDGGSVSAGGDVRVAYGVRGGDGGAVCAEGNVSIHHAEAATVYAGRLLQMGEAVHSQLAAVRIEVSGKLRGGYAQAETSIVAREVGSPQGVDTELRVAEPLDPPVESARRALEREKALRAAKAGPREDPGERAKGGKLGRVQAALANAETERLAERARRREALSQVAFVQVGAAHAGVIVHIAGRKLVLEHDIRTSRFSLDLETGELRAVKLGQ